MEDYAKYIQVLLQKIDECGYIERYAIYTHDTNWKTHVFYDLKEGDKSYPNKGWISTVGEVENGYDNIVIDNDTTAVTIHNNQIKQNIYIDKVTNAEYDYVTDFKVRIQKKVGNDYVDINDALVVYKKYGTTDQTGPTALGYTNIEGGGYEYTINKGDRIVVSDVSKNTQIRIIESD